MDTPIAPPPVAESVDTHRVDVRPAELVIDITGTSESNFFVGFKGGTSKGGLFVATHLNLAVGEVLAVAFTLPGIEGSQRVKCEVAWVRAQNALSNVSPGAGLKILDGDAAQYALIERFIANRPAMFYEQ